MRSVNFADYVERRMAAEGITIDMPDGSTITIPPAELWVDEAFDLLGRGESKAACSKVLGDDQFARFVELGGNWRILNGIIREAEGAPLGESEASSG